MATRPSRLQHDAVALYEAATAFIRVYQFRDRDQSLRSGLTVVQAYALDLLIAARGMPVTELAHALHLDKSTTSRIVAGMKRRGLVRLERGGDDARVVNVIASADGKRRYARLKAAIVADNKRVLADYDPATRKALVAMLRRLATRAGALPPAS